MLTGCGRAHNALRFVNGLSVHAQRAENTKGTCVQGYIYATPLISPVSSQFKMPNHELRTVKSHSRNRPSNLPVHWLFRSNIPRRRTSFLPADIQKRNFFGMGEIVGVLTNPAETVRSLTESKRLLEDARREIEENKERSQLRVTHTFSRYPGFFPRRAEMRILNQILEGEPAFTVLFGSSSVGKTALLREVLCGDKYHVLHFDLRIAGFADLPSLYMSLSQQMQQYFEEVGQMPGYDDFEKEAWGFKHDRLNVERRMAEMPVGTDGRNIRTSDIARLMELFQSSLLKYREFEPADEVPVKKRESKTEEKPPRRRFWFRKSKANDVRSIPSEKEPSDKPPAKKIPVIFFDEAHRLPSLVQSMETMKCLLDAMLVLTKQDRLCHVIHATSDPFYQTWLRQLNIMQHCKIITIGDCSRAETREYFNERILPRVPRRLGMRLDFDRLYEAFGGKLAHWHDYCTDFINSNGTLDIKQSSHFLQAHALLNLHLIHSSQSVTSKSTKEESRMSRGAPSGFRIYSPISHPYGPNDSPASGDYKADFTAVELLKVINHLVEPTVQYIPYFPLCRELSVRSVDGMVKGRVLDLRWTECVTDEYAYEEARTAHNRRNTSSDTAVDNDQASETGDSDILPASQYSKDGPEVVGCKLVPSPIMRYAMREVAQEYDESDQKTMSDYRSLSDVEVEEY
ncbi:unnamed protein product [Mycena citricolor]|uniref:ATPase domain-containing protein n=2 Tax=Mycena citricolor TaxID=2018698 RepID=A0AAD2HL95_9AGAR|nr:unnamed protein product [Mycena citricolor]